SSNRWIRLSATPAIAIAVLSTVAALASAQRLDGEVDVDVLAQQWILAHVERGSRVALHDEDNAAVPRTTEQLRQCIAYGRDPAAWREKWHVEGVDAGENVTTPMEALLLTDERFKAYWCARELEAQKEPGYWIVPYHGEPRF